MSRRRTVRWALGLAVLALAGAIIAARWNRGPQLPPMAHHPRLPPQFDDALRGERASIVSVGRDTDAVRNLAHLYQANRLYPEARACFLVIASGPGGLSARDHYCLADMAQEESDLGVAEAELRATLQSEPGYVPARLTLADALFKTDRPDEAYREYETVLSADAGQPQALFGLARIKLQRGDDSGALATLEELVSRHPDSTSGAALLAQVLGRLGRTEEAASVAEECRQMHEPVPPDLWLSFLLVDCYDLQRLGLAFEAYRLSGQMDEALPLLDRLQDLDPEGWIAPMLRGWSLKKAGRYPEAAQQYRLSLKNGGDPERICPLLVADLLTEGKPEEAAALLADYHARLPHSIPILLSYSETASRLGDEQLARQLLGEVLQSEPYLYMPNMTMVQILWSSGEHDAAAPYLQRVARTFPADVDSRGLLGQYYMEKADPVAAIKPLEQALSRLAERNPRRDRIVGMLDTAYLTAGSLEASEGNFAGAVNYAEESIRLSPGGMRGYALKANVCRHGGDFKGEEDALEKMSALQPGEPGLQLSLGDACYQEGDRDRAREHWQKALQLAPPEASELRGKLGLRLAGNVSPETFR